MRHCGAPAHLCHTLALPRIAPLHGPALPTAASRSPVRSTTPPRSPGNRQRPRVLATLSHGGSGTPRRGVRLPPSTRQPPPPLQPYNIRPCNPPSHPYTAPPCVPALCPYAAPRGALAEPKATLQRRASPCAVPPRPRGCRALTACGLLSAAPRPTPPPQPTRPSEPSHRRPRRMACTGPMGSRQRPSAPAYAQLRGSQEKYPDRGQPPRRERSERPLPRPPAEEPRSGPIPYGTPPPRAAQPPRARGRSHVPQGPRCLLQQPIAHPTLTTRKGTGTQGYRPYIPPTHPPTLLHLRTGSTPPPL